MKRISESNNKCRWPRQAVTAIDCRKRDLIVRIADWTRDKDEPAYDVEIYIGGVYDWNESATFTLYEHGTKTVARLKATLYAQSQIAKLL